MADDEDLNEDEFRTPTNERLKQSKKKRAQQLRKYAQHEKQLEKECGKKSKRLEKATERKNDKKIQFPGNVTLLEAAARDDKDEVRRLLQMGVSPDVCNDDGLTALHQCCIDDAGGMMNVLLDFHANVNATDCELWTPLHAAATCGRVNLCRTLIEHGADLLAVNGDGNMPYDICDHEATLDYIEYEMAKQGITQDIIDKTRLVRENKMLEDLKELHGQNGDLEFRGRNGETPLHIAAANGYLDVADFLLSHRVRVDTVDSDLWQPVHCASCWGQLSVLELLLEHGANLEAKTNSGATAIEICEDSEMKQRILEIKEEIENSRITKSRELSRRHSSTIRRNLASQRTSGIFSSQVSVEKSPMSASVRRTSMREKNEMSWKEAKEEARMRESTQMYQDNEDEDVERGKENGRLSSPEHNKNASSGGKHLTPIASVDEILDSQINEPSSPRSPELIGRGVVGFGTKSSLLGSDENIKQESTSGKTNGLSSPVSVLKKPRLSDQLPTDPADSTGSSRNTNQAMSNKAPHIEPLVLQTSSSTDFLKPPHKASNRQLNIANKCCTIL